jgi:hypothetical protein
LPSLFDYRKNLDDLSNKLSQITQRVGNWVSAGHGDVEKTTNEFAESQRELAQRLVRKDMSVSLVSQDYTSDELKTAGLILKTYKDGAVGHRRYEIMEDLFKTLEIGNLDREARLEQLTAFSELVEKKNSLSDGDTDPLSGLSLDGIHIAKPHEDAGERRIVTLSGGFFGVLENIFESKSNHRSDLLKLNQLHSHKLAVVDCLLGTAARYFEKSERRQGTVISNLANERFLVLVRAINYFAAL